MVRPRRTWALYGAVALVGLVACGSTPSTPATGSTSTVTMSAASTSIVQRVQPESETSAADSEPVDIPITPGGDPVVVNEPATGASAVLVVDGDRFSPLSVAIPVGGVVTFEAGDAGAHGIRVGALDAVTVSGGLVEYYQFPLAGTFEVTDELSDATATIVVG